MDQWTSRSVDDVDGGTQHIVERGGGVGGGHGGEHQIPRLEALQQRGDDLRPGPRGDRAQRVAVPRDDAHVTLGDVEVVGLR